MLLLSSEVWKVCHLICNLKKSQGIKPLPESGKKKIWCLDLFYTFFSQGNLICFPLHLVSDEFNTANNSMLNGCQIWSSPSVQGWIRYWSLSWSLWFSCRCAGRPDTWSCVWSAWKTGMGSWRMEGAVVETGTWGGARGVALWSATRILGHAWRSTRWRSWPRAHARMGWWARPSSEGTHFGWMDSGITGTRATTLGL